MFRQILHLFASTALLVLACSTTCAAETGLEECHKGTEAERLKCYDQRTGYQAPVPSAPLSAPTTKVEASTAETAAAPGKPDTKAAGNTKVNREKDPSCFLQGFSGIRGSSHGLAEDNSLFRQWALGDEEQGVDELQPYRPNYAIFRHSDGVNVAPFSQAVGRSVTDAESFQYTELKFQLSFKSELVAPRCIDLWTHTSRRWRFWFAYTQQSNWQILNSTTSRPFRNSNYEPEAIATFRFSEEKDSKWQPRLLNFAFVHQSNGQANPKSRSWNRIYLQGGWQLSKEWSLMARTWYRLRDSDDDNPDIQQYFGRGDAVLRWGSGSNTVQLLARNTFHANSNREFLQLDYSFKFPGIGPKLHFQASSGFGESLIDYNFRQKTIGLGLSFSDW